MLAKAHDGEHLSKFEDLLEAAIDLDRIPDEYLISASYDPGLQASTMLLQKSRGQIYFNFLKLHSVALCLLYLAPSALSEVQARNFAD